MVSLVSVDIATSLLVQLLGFYDSLTDIYKSDRLKEFPQQTSMARRQFAGAAREVLQAKDELPNLR